MDGNSDVSDEQELLQIDAFPDSLAAGATVLIASAGDPSRYALSLRVLCQYGSADDVALIVTTTERADETLKTYGRLCPESDRPSLGLVDTISKQQSVSALYSETPIVFTPSPGNLERLVLGLSDLPENKLPSNGRRHFVIQSLTPILRTAPVARVCTVLECITKLRTENGLCLLGVDYTAHSEEVMIALAEQVDGILWVTQSASDRLEFEYRPIRGGPSRPWPASSGNDEG